jgi:DNA-binding NarL/FixJ family response regulator
MNTENGSIRIVMADDHEIFRDGFQLIISKAAHMELVAQASNGRELLEQVSSCLPDVVVTDIRMPQMDGISATREIRNKFPGIGVIGLSMHDEDDLILEMLEAGAKGYLLKNADKAEVLEAIETVYEGDPYYCHTTNSKLARIIAKNRYHTFHRNEKPDFSEKELEIIQLICQEYTNKEVGEKLFLSVRTIEGYRLKILEKMGVKNSVGLVVYAIQHGIFHPTT